MIGGDAATGGMCEHHTLLSCTMGGTTEMARVTTNSRTRCTLKMSTSRLRCSTARALSNASTVDNIVPNVSNNTCTYATKEPILHSRTQERKIESGREGILER